jgi:hypothetical protein
MRARTLTLTAITAFAVGGSATAATRPTRPDHADWLKIKAAAGLRRLALAPNRTARFRAFSASLGLTELTTIHPLGPGPCATAVVYLYNNLLDLDNAQPGEKWAPLRHLVAKEPSIAACAPHHSHHPQPPSTGATLHIHAPPKRGGNGPDRKDGGRSEP